MSLEQKDEDSPTWTEGLPITLSQLEMLCVSNLFFLGEPRRQRPLLHPQPRLTRHHTQLALMQPA